jgi:hypothetical protein
MWGVVFAGALAALPACNIEYILAIASGRDAGGNPSDAGGTWTPFGTPQVVTGLRGGAEEVQDPSLTFEELEIYFTSPRGPLSDIWVSRRTVVTDPWGPSTLVAELSSPQADEDPDVSVDGLTMYFTSDRAGDGRRLYVSRRRTRDTAWEAPMRIASLGTSTVDEAPAVDRAQLYLVFASQRGTAAYPHLFAATRPDASAVWEGVSELAALNSAWHDTDPALFADGRGLVFASRRLTQTRGADLFQASRADSSSASFSSLAPITELNTDFTEEDPWLSQNGRHILFTSNRDGTSRIYEAWR